MTELTPEQIDNVEFREKWRGYDPRQVDAFIEQVAATIASLRARLVDAEERARPADGHVPSADDH